MSLRDAMRLHTWEYSATSSGGSRSRFVINEHLTGAVLGTQRPARINFRTALLIVWGWNQLGDTRYRLVIPNQQS